MNLAEIVNDNSPAYATKDQLAAVHERLRNVPAVPLPTRHYFAGGMYCREGLIPKDTLIVGKIHKTEHFIMVLIGRITVWTENGKVELQAPYIGICPPGVQRMGYAHEDTVFVNVHKTDKTDLAEVEADLVVDDPTSVYGVGNVIQQQIAVESVKCLD